MAKKKKWKKRLGKALAAGAALAGGLALARRRNRAASMADVEGAEAGFGDMKLKNYGPHKIGGYHTPRVKRPIWQGATNPSGDIFGMDATGDIQYAMPAKGGRIVKTKKGGVARRGLGRAFLKGRK